MKRLVLNALTVLSLALCLAMVALWVSSHRVEHYAYWGGWTTDGRRMVERRVWVTWIQGRVGFGERCHDRRAGQFADDAKRLREPHFRWLQLPLPGYSVWSIPGLSFWQRNGFLYRVEGTPPPLDPFDAFLHRSPFVAVPSAIPVAALAILPAARLARRARNRRRLGRGLCPRCGYDLRGNPAAGHCPECGL